MFLRLIKKNHTRRARIFRIKWVRAHRKLCKIRKMLRKCHVKQLKKKVSKWRRVLRRWIKKERKIRILFIRNFHNKWRLTVLTKKWRRCRLRIRKIRRIIYIAKKRRLTIRIKFNARKVRFWVKKMLRIRRAIRVAKRRGHLVIVSRLRIKFVFYQRKVRKFKVVVYRLRRRLIIVKMTRARKVFRRALKRARKLHRLYIIAKAKSSGHISFCAHIIKGQERKALALARKYRRIFRAIRVKFHHH
jgi:hypothetical protein